MIHILDSFHFPRDGTVLSVLRDRQIQMAYLVAVRQPDGRYLIEKDRWARPGDPKVVTYQTLLQIVELTLAHAAHPSEPAHDWWVISTALGTGQLVLECRCTGAKGVVSNPTHREWGAAFHAPSTPYRWTEHERVEVIT